MVAMAVYHFGASSRLMDGCIGRLVRLLEFRDTSYFGFYIYFGGL